MCTKVDSDHTGVCIVVVCRAVSQSSRNESIETLIQVYKVMYCEPRTFLDTGAVSIPQLDHHALVARVWLVAVCATCPPVVLLAQMTIHIVWAASSTICSKSFVNGMLYL